MHKIYLISVSLFVMFSSVLYAQDHKELTVEEKRLKKAKLSMPLVLNRFSTVISQFKVSLENIENYKAVDTMVSQKSHELWKKAVQSYKKLNDYDDRALYWARLQLTKTLRLSSKFKSLSSEQQQKLLWKMELLSRGNKI